MSRSGAHASEEIKHREQFVLLDEQQVAFRTVQQAMDSAGDENTKTVVVVLGGPGSGKSVVALSLLGELSRAGRRVLHAIGSSSFTNTLRKIVVGSRSNRVQQMFVYFNSFIGERKNSLDVLICDEAHRLRETSVNRFTKADRQAVAKRQIEELIDVAYTPVFLLDEHQVVRPGEMGTKAEIRAAAKAAGCRVRVVELEGQYRCGGSVAYDQWVLRLLGLTSLPPVPWSALTSGSDDHAWLARRDRSFDGQVKRSSEEEFPALVRNTYKVLLTRGMKGTAVYSTDPETQTFLSLAGLTPGAGAPVEPSVGSATWRSATDVHADR